MDRGRKALFLPLSFFCFFFFTSLHAKKIIFRGFLHHDPHHIIKEPVEALTGADIRTALERSGFFRKVSCTENQEAVIVTVKEYPILKQVIFRGNSVFPEDRLRKQLALKPGRPFNSRYFTEQLAGFYRKCKEDGYTHWQVTAARIMENGDLVLDIDEGILVDVEVEGDLIDIRIVRRFFRHLLGKPFNSHSVKYILEEMLFTEAFYEIRSRVIRREGRLLLRLIPERKQMRRMASSIEYSNFGGFQAFNLISGVKSNNRLDFLDLSARFADHEDSTVFQLIIDPHDFRRYLERSRLSLSLETRYVSLDDASDLFFRLKSRWHLSLFKPVMLSLFFSGGIHKNFNGLENKLIAEYGMDLSFRYRSPLNRTTFTVSLERVGSILGDYQWWRIVFEGIQQFPVGDLNVFGLWNTFSGDRHPFNLYLIPFEKTAFINVDQMLGREMRFASVEFSSRPITRFLRLGFIGQYFDTGEVELGYGLTLHVNIKGFPVRMAGIVREGHFYLLAGLRFSL